MQITSTISWYALLQALQSLDRYGRWATCKVLELVLWSTYLLPLLLLLSLPFPQVVVASVGTAVNCIPQLAQCRFSLVIVDEAHHSVANTYKTVLRGLGFVEEFAAPSGSNSSSDKAADVDGSHNSLSDLKQYVDSRAELEKELLGPDTQADTDAAAINNEDFSNDSCSGSGSIESMDGTDISLLEISQDDSAAGDGSSISSSSEDEPVQRTPTRTLRAVNNPNSLCVGFTATPYR
jgi:hypothetical protein